MDHRSSTGHDSEELGCSTGLGLLSAGIHAAALVDLSRQLADRGYCAGPFAVAAPEALVI